MMEELAAEKVEMGSCRDQRVGDSVLFIQKRMNKYGKFLELTEFVRGKKRSYIVLPEGREGGGWRHCISQLGRLSKHIGKEVAKPNLKSVQIQPVEEGRTWADFC